MVCEFIDYLGWFSMTAYQQWDVFSKILAAGTVIVIAWITSRRWRLGKKIEIEQTLIENMAFGRALFYDSKDSSTVDEATRKEFKKKLEMYTRTTNRILSKNLGLAELRKLNKQHIAATKFIQESLAINEQA